MRIGIDARALAPPVTGTGVYLRELLAEIGKLAPEIELFCYSTKAPAEGTLPANACLRLGRGLMARWGTVWMQTKVPRLAAEDRLDLFWGPLQVLPLRLIGVVPTVVTVHDLVFRRYPETMSWRNRLILGRYAERSIRGASQVLADSETGVRDLIEEFGAEPNRVTAVLSAASEAFRPLEPTQARELLGDSLRLGGDPLGNQAPDDAPTDDDYLLFVGTQEPRKNLVGLLDALELLAAESSFDGWVVFAGLAGWRGSPLHRKVEGHPLRDRMRFLGYVDDELLPFLYAGARAFVMPSLYEGFGLPVVEAMKSGTPVICSNADPFPEIADDAAQLVDATDRHALAAAIESVWTDAGLRGQLREKGIEQAARFSWRRSAERLLEVFAHIAGDDGATTARGALRC